MDAYGKARSVSAGERAKPDPRWTTGKAEGYRTDAVEEERLAARNAVALALQGYAVEHIATVLGRSVEECREWVKRAGLRVRREPRWKSCPTCGGELEEGATYCSRPCANAGSQLG